MARRNENRRKRTPLGVPRLKMNLDSETMARLKAEKKVPRWVNDTDTRIQDAIAGDYEFLTIDAKVGDKEEEVERQKISKVVGRNKDGSPMRAYLMAIPEEYHESDQQAKEEINKKVDEAVRGGTPTGLGHHGVDPSRGGSYVKSVDYKP